MSKKKKVWLSVLVVLLIGVGIGIKKVKSMLRGGNIEDIAVFVPADVSLFVANRGAGEQHFEFSQMGEIMDEAGPRTSHYLDIAREAAMPVLGFDPLVSKNWQDTGMSFFRPAGVAIAGDSLETIHLLFFLPVGSKTTLLSTLDGIFTNAGGTVDIESVADHELHVVKGLGGFFPLALHYAEHDDYIIGTFGMEGSFEPVATLEGIWNMTTEASLMGDVAFNNRIKSVGSTWHSLTYTSPEAMEMAMTGVKELAGMYGIDTSALPVGGSAGMGTTHLTDDRFRYRGSQRMETGLVDPAWFAGVSGTDKLGSRIPGEALLAGRVSLNLKSMWSSSMAQDMGAEAFLTQLLADGLNIEIERDLVNNITGDISAAVFAPNMESMVPEAIVYAPLNDPAPIETLVDNGCRILTLWGAQLERNDAGIWCSDGVMLFFGVAHDHFLLGSSEDTTQYQVLQGEGYLSSLGKAAQSGMKGGPPAFLYVDTDAVMGLAEQESETMEMMLGFEPTLPPSIPVEGLSLSLNLVKSSAETDIESQRKDTPYDSRVEVQAIFQEDGLQDWLANNLESMVVWMEDSANVGTGSADNGSSASSGGGLTATLQEISSWQIMGAEELGEPYAACGSEEKAAALVNGGDPNTVYTNEDRTCFENIGWIPATGSTAFWTTVEGPEGAPTAFTVHGIEQAPGGPTTETLRHPAAP